MTCDNCGRARRVKVMWGWRIGRPPYKTSPACCFRCRFMARLFLCVAIAVGARRG